MKIKSKIIALFLFMVFTVLVASPALPVRGAEGVRIVSSAGTLLGAFGQYVVYEMDGVTYNTKDGDTHKNLEAWNRMTDEQKKVVYDSLFTSAAKKTAFGTSGVEMLSDWNKKSSSYYNANREWQLRIAKRDYPELTAKFGDGASLETLYSEYFGLSNYQIPSDASWWYEAQAFREALAALQKEYQIGREYYEKTIEMRTKGIANVVTITITQCTVMLSDMLFVPSIAKGAANEASSHIADIMNFLKDFAMAEKNDFSAKFLRYQSGETGVPFTPAETVKLFGALMNAYAKMAEKSLKKTDAAMLNLIMRHRRLTEGYEYYQWDIQQQNQARAQAKQDYFDALGEKYSDEEIPPTGEYKGLNFSWFTREQLTNQYGSVNYTYTERQNAVFNAVLRKKAELDLEAGYAAEVLYDNIVNSYNEIVERLNNKEDERDALVSDIDRDCSGNAMSGYISHDWDGDGFGDFTGLDVFADVLGIGGGAVELRKDSWPYVLEILSGGITKLQSLRGSALSFVNSMDNLASDIKPFLEDLSSNLEQMRRLINDYLTLYDSAVWYLDGFSQSAFINPYRTEEYSVNVVKDIYINLNDTEKYDRLYSDLIYGNSEVLKKLSSTIPTDIFNSSYLSYEKVLRDLDFLITRKDAVLGHYNNFIADEAAYYNELDKRLGAYVKVRDKMAQKYSQLNQAAVGYQNLWEGAYFKGYDDYNSSADAYNFDGSSRPFSAFKASDIRSYIRGGGSRFALLSKIRDLADYAASYEAITKDLVAQINMLDIEMDAITDNTLRGYAEGKGVEYKSIYSFRADYPNINWARIDNETYFNLYDIDFIMSALSDNSVIFSLMRDYRAELLGYLNSSSVNTVKVSNRMYEIYAFASRVYELYSGSFYDKTFLTPQQRSELLSIYRNGTGTGDIDGTLQDIKAKHSGTSFSFYSMPSDNGTDYYEPIGDFEPAALAGDRVSITAPMYYPIASGVSTAQIKVYEYGENGWEPILTNNQSQLMSGGEGGGVQLYPADNLNAPEISDDLEIVIDKENSTMTIYAKGLKNNGRYRFEWDITYTYDGFYQVGKEKGDAIKTITYEPTVAVTAALDDDQHSALVSITNLTGNLISGKYVYLDGFGEGGEPIATVGAAVSAMEPMDVLAMTLVFDKPVYTVSAYIADAYLAAPAKIVIKKDGAKAASIVAAPPAALTFTADVFDPLGSLLPFEGVVWAVAPAGMGVSASGGVVSIGENTPAGSYTVTARAGAVEDEIILTVEDYAPESRLVYNGLIKKGGVISGGLTLEILNNNSAVESCVFLVAVYDKEKNVLKAINESATPISPGLNAISLDDLYFSVNPDKAYEVRIFSWITLGGLNPITSMLKSDI